MSPRFLSRMPSVVLLIAVTGIGVVFLLAPVPAAPDSASTNAKTPTTSTTVNKTETVTKTGNVTKTVTDTETATTIKTPKPGGKKGACPACPDSFVLTDVYMEQAGTATFKGKPSEAISSLGKDGCKKTLAAIVEIVAKLANTSHCLDDCKKSPAGIVEIPLHAADYPNAERTLTLNGTAVGVQFASWPDPIFPLARGEMVTQISPSLGLGSFLDALRGQHVELTIPATTSATGANASPSGSSGQPEGSAAPASPGSPQSASSAKKLKGQILGVEAAVSQNNQNQGQSNNPTVEKSGNTTPGQGNSAAGRSYTLNLSTGNGFVAVPLTGGTTVRLTDPRASGQLQEALDELARGNVLNDRTLRVPLFPSDGKVCSQEIRYSHPGSGWILQYRLQLADSCLIPFDFGSLITLVTVRNTTALDWRCVNLHVVGLPKCQFCDPPGECVHPVTLCKDQVGTFQVGSQCVCNCRASLTYTTGQSSPFPDQEFVLQGASIPSSASITVSIGNYAVGETTAGQTQRDGTLKLKFSNKLVTIRPMEITVEPKQVCLANGFLDYVDVRCTMLSVLDCSCIPHKLQLKAAEGWHLACPCDAQWISVGKPHCLSLQEVSDCRHVALAGMTDADLKQFIGSLPQADPLRSCLNAVQRGRSDLKKQLTCLDVERQAAADALKAIARRQTTPSGMPLIPLKDQMLRDEIGAAHLLHQMDQLAAQKAQLLLDFERFVCGLHGSPSNWAPSPCPDPATASPAGP